MFLSNFTDVFYQENLYILATINMKRIFIYLSLISFLGGCSSPDIVKAFSKLEKSNMEIRLGHMPELEINQCNRNMYAGFRSNDVEPIDLTLDVVITSDELPMQRYKRDWRIEKVSRKKLLVGQVPLFPETIEQHCSKIHVTMLALQCSDSSTGETKACPQHIRWNWLQGFEMIEVPKIIR